MTVLRQWVLANRCIAPYDRDCILHETGSDNTVREHIGWVRLVFSKALRMVELKERIKGLESRSSENGGHNVR